MGQDIKVGILVSYDFNYVKTNIPRIYDYADKIYLAIDKNRLTWSGNKFEITNDFFLWIEQYDTQGKIKIYEDNFYIPELSVKENDTRERNLLGEFMGSGGWHIQIDSDEYFINFESFSKQLKALHLSKNTTVFVPWLTLFKKLDNNYLYIRGAIEYCPIATNNPNYTDYRLNHENSTVNLDSILIHESWSRNESELYTKLTNWSHKNDFNILSYFNFWKAIDQNNFMYVNNFHPITPNVWKRLGILSGKSIVELIDNLKTKENINSIFEITQSIDEESFFTILKRKISRKLRFK